MYRNLKVISTFDGWVIYESKTSRKDYTYLILHKRCNMGGVLGRYEFCMCREKIPDNILTTVRLLNGM